MNERRKASNDFPLDFNINYESGHVPFGSLKLMFGGRVYIVCLKVKMKYNSFSNLHNLYELVQVKLCQLLMI